MLGVDVELAIPETNNEEFHCANELCEKKETDLSVFVLEANVNPSLNFLVPEEEVHGYNWNNGLLNKGPKNRGGIRYVQYAWSWYCIR